MYWSLLQLAQAPHTRSAVAEQFETMYCPAWQPSVQAAHTVSCRPLQEVASYCPAEHVEQGAHTVSADVVQGVDA